MYRCVLETSPEELQGSNLGARAIQDDDRHTSGCLHRIEGLQASGVAETAGSTASSATFGIQVAGTDHYHPQKGPQVNAQMFTNARNVMVSGGAFHITTQNFLNDVHRPLEALLKRVAQNGILNAGGRADEVRCHPGTREVVIRLTEEWALDAKRGLVPRLCWLSGPAGAGKSAIAQTIAERSRDRQEPQINFFFFRVDGSRNTAASLVPTLLYQALQLYPQLQGQVESALLRDPLILEKPIQDIQNQFRSLISSPLQSIQTTTNQPHPIMIIVDGLDECDTEQAQEKIIYALGQLVQDENLPFIILLASRKERCIEMALKTIDKSVQHIFLDETYSPEEDIALFVRDKFQEIKTRHPLAHTCPPNWPSQADINRVVWNSSGQFVYAATAMRFILTSRASPEHSLNKITGLAPLGKTSPFTHIDAIYTFILSQVDDWPTTRHVLAIQILVQTIGMTARHSRRQGPLDPLILLQLYDHSYASPSVLVSCAAELSAISRLGRDNIMEFYHKSFIDFIIGNVRAGEHWLDMDKVVCEILDLTWTTTEWDLKRFLVVMFCGLQTLSPDATSKFIAQPPPLWTMECSSHRLGQIIDSLRRLHDATTFSLIIKNFQSYGYTHYEDRRGFPKFEWRVD